ncbi:MAG: LysM peptidoglycan-binding domain-containing protein [Candidatus Moranbacteria bacterium]|nr:LysM peptidoglycan-binding domain-containing protein [Candidatus Moranbacteria bacterium]
MLKRESLLPLPPIEGTPPIALLSFIHKSLSRIRESVVRWYAEAETIAHRVQSEYFSVLRNGIGKDVAEAFRNYGSFSLVVSSVLLVSMTNFTQEEGSKSAVFGRFRVSEPQANEMPRKRFATEEPKKIGLSQVQLEKSFTGIDIEAKQEEETSAVFRSGALLSAQTESSIARDPEEEGGVTIYTVKDGDTISGIAAGHGITVNTILWANDLDNVDAIKPGDQIFILPIAGLSHTVASGETLDSITSKFKADREAIISFNSLPANGDLTVGDTIVIPGGSKEAPKPTVGIGLRQYASSTGGGAVTDISGGYRKLDGRAGAGHRFPYGYCTWYVAQKRYVPWGGNAGAWLYNARSQGYRTGKSPSVGAIVVTTDSAYYGHVALVENVSGGTITVSEMNYNAWGKVNRRVIATSSRSIKGYIY